MAAAQSNSQFRVAAAQYPLDEVASFSAWQTKIRHWVHEGAETGADLLLFPEYAALELAATFGSSVASDLEQSLRKVAELAGARTELHVTLAAEFGVHIAAGSGPIQTNDGMYVNAAQLITPKGLIGEQEKMMMTRFERDWGIAPGNRLKVFKTSLATFAFAICYDVEFPLLAHAAASQGADCLLVPSCTDRVSGFNRVKTGALARALENTIVTVQSPTVGDALWSPVIDRNTGAAGVYVPAEHGFSDTGILAEGQLNVPGWVVADVDLKRLRALREGGEMRNFNDWHVQPGTTGPLMTETIDLGTPE